MSEQWYTSTDEEFRSQAGPYATREEAATEGPKELELPDGSEFFIGRAIPPSIITPTGASFCDDAQQRTLEALTPELAELGDDWLVEIPKDAVDALSVLLSKVFDSWLTEFNLRPTFFVIGHIQEHTL